MYSLTQIQATFHVFVCYAVRSSLGDQSCCMPHHSMSAFHHERRSVVCFLKQRLLYVLARYENIWCTLVAAGGHFVSAFVSL